MKLNDFTEHPVLQIMQGANAADGELKKSGVGGIYKDKFEKTMAQNLVTFA